ncbi:helix-turn-helix domain-containing protein [Streptomyces venezuelae]|uniref:helix-turn-helix domain-containing protein n=1 Tax=Streptomyces venezuelae TaxID=54571 RepID=UPI003448D673
MQSSLSQTLDSLGSRSPLGARSGELKGGKAARDGEKRGKRGGAIGTTEALRQDGRLGGLLHEVQRQVVCGAEPNTRRVLEWLHRQTGAHIALVAPDVRTVESSTPEFPSRTLRPIAPLLARVRDGRLAAAATQTEGLHVRCEALALPGPRPVLVVVCPEALPPDTAALISHTSSVLSLLRQAGDSGRLQRDYQRKARQLRLAVLHGLLAEGPILARRMTSGAVPPLLETNRLRVHLLRCPSTDRDRIAQAHEDPSGYHGPDLMVHCPVFKEHLICLVADDAGEDHSGGRPPSLSETLRCLVRDNPRYAMGISGAHPLGATAEAYGQAAHALAAARATPDRVAFYHGRTPLVSALPQQPAAQWARALLRPLDSVPRTSADITRLAMIAPRSGVARLLGMSRNTVTAHLKHAEHALSQNLKDVRCRATVHLALALSGSCADSVAEDPRQQPPALDDLLRTEPAAAWARTLLGALQARHRRTLRAWLDANTDAQQAARRLGMNRNTIRAHLRTAEAVLGVDLLTHGTGVYDIVHALHILEIRTAVSTVHD